MLTKRWLLSILSLSLSISLIAQDFSREVKKYIEVSEDRIALTNAKVVDGNGGPVKEDQYLIIEDGKIVQMGPYASDKLPEVDTVIDCSGKTVIPGFVMLHEHLFYSKSIDHQFHTDHMTFTFPKMYLAGGATTIRTAGTIEGHTDLNVKKMVDQGKMAGPDIHVTSPHLDGAMYIPQLSYLEEGEDPVNFVNYWAEQGVTSYKVYMNLKKPDLQKIVDAAHKRGLKVTGHLCGVTYKEAAEAGIDNIEHAFMQASDFIKDKEADKCDPRAIAKSLLNLDRDSKEMEELMQFLIEKEVALTATPAVFAPYTGHEVVHGGGLKALAPGIQNLVLSHYARGINNDSASQALFEKELYWIKKFYDMGGKLVVGTDPTGAGRTLAGYANQYTIEILMQAGFTLPEAIQVATKNGAEFLEVAKQKGTLEEGKQADLVIINGDLKENISNIRNMEVVFKNGIGYHSKKIFKSVEGKVGL
jgi:imidazolonepropionase-like amidohydrolase